PSARAPSRVSPPRRGRRTAARPAGPVRARMSSTRPCDHHGGGGTRGGAALPGPDGRRRRALPGLADVLLLAAQDLRICGRARVLAVAETACRRYAAAPDRHLD